MVAQGHAKWIEQSEECVLSEDGNFYSNEINGLCEELKDVVELTE